MNAIFRSIFCGASLAACAASPADPPRAAPHSAAAPSPLASAEWTLLFDGRTLGAWRPSAFGGEGAVRVAGGWIECDFGSPLSGVTFAGEHPRDNYELVLEAEKLAGNDFFCGLTFPVGDAQATLILGGWGGAVVGLSCVDGLDAARNATKLVRGFERNRTYHVRVAVHADRIAAYLDGAPVITQERAGHAFSLRPEVLPSGPLGVACYATRARWRALAYRRIE